jgi:hypothetical protein
MTEATRRANTPLTVRTERDQNGVWRATVATMGRRPKVLHVTAGSYREDGAGEDARFWAATNGYRHYHGL